MKKIYIPTLSMIFLVFFISASAMATPWTDHTLHWEGWLDGRTAVDNVDAYGTPLFSGGTYNASNGKLYQLTFDYSVNSLGSILGAGDLFIDRDANGIWDYLVPISKGLTDIYNINIAENNHSGVYEMSNAPGYDWRKNHPIALIPGNYGLDTTKDVAYSGFHNTPPGAYTTIFDFEGLDVGNEFIFAWTVTCANDVVKEKVSVPEPSGIILLIFGLLGVGAGIRRKPEGM